MVVEQAKLSSKIFRAKIPALPTRNGYGDGLVDAAQKDKNVVALCCDLTESTRTEVFAKKFPDRFIEVGVAEQNLMGVSVGLALEGKIPFAASYAVFSPGRNWDQIRVSVCYNNANVKIVGAHAGVSVGPDGATHQALEDIAITRVLPKMTGVVPADYHEARKATIAAAQHKGPVYLRFTREKSPVFTTEKSPFAIGRAQVLWKSEQAKVVIIGCGPVVYEALLAAKILSQQGVLVTVINNHTIKPLDEHTLLSETKYAKHIVTIEEHQVFGGLFGALAEFFSVNRPIHITPLAVPDTFGESGTPDQLLDLFKLRSNEIVQRVTEFSYA